MFVEGFNREGDSKTQGLVSQSHKLQHTLLPSQEHHLPHNITINVHWETQEASLPAACLWIPEKRY